MTATVATTASAVPIALVANQRSNPQAALCAKMGATAVITAPVVKLALAAKNKRACTFRSSSLAGQNYYFTSTGPKPPTALFPASSDFIFNYSTNK